MRKVIVGILLLAVLFVGGSWVQESIYCGGYTQGFIDRTAAQHGPPPPEFDPSPWYAACPLAPNDPYDIGDRGVPRYYTGNYFDKVVDAVKDRF